MSTGSIPYRDPNQSTGTPIGDPTVYPNINPNYPTVPSQFPFYQNIPNNPDFFFKSNPATSGYITFPPSEPQKLRVQKLHEDAKLPTKAHSGDLGYDMYALEDTTIAQGTLVKVRTGIALQFPVGFGGLIRDRSSVATKPEYQLFVVAGVIDNGYTGEVVIALFHPFKTLSALSAQVAAVTIKKGEKIAQIIPWFVSDFPVLEVSSLGETERGNNGFGSTGK